MKHNRMLSMLLAILMLFTVAFPMSVFADEDELLEEEYVADENTYGEEEVQEEYVYADDEYADAPSEVEDAPSAEDAEVVEEAAAEAEAQEPETAPEAPEEIDAGELEIVDTAEYEAAAITIKTQPQSVTAASGKVTFTVEAVGNGLTYQWYYKAPSDSKYTKASSTKASCNVTVSEKLDGYKFACVITDKAGNTVNSKAATLTVAKAGITIKGQPQSIKASSGKVTFSVEAEGTGLTYQWYYKAPGDSKYTKAASTNKTCNVTVSEKLNGYKFACVITDAYGNTKNSDAATLTVVKTGITIKTQPKSVKASSGKVTFTVEAEGDGLTYQWYYKAPSDSKYTKAASTKATCSVTVSEKLNGYKFVCVISDKYGNTKNSSVATLTVETKIVLNDVTYEPITSSTCRVVSYSGKAATLKIPETVNGLTVTEIGEEAFMNNTTLTSIDLPDTITVIRARAFKGCTSLTTMK